MRLYAGTSLQFIEDTTQNQIAEKLKQAFFEYFRSNPSPSEMNSWRNSLRALSLTFESAKLLDHGIILEYQIPSTSKRIDCLICGKNDKGQDNAVIIELKQWDTSKKSDGENEVRIWMRGKLVDHLHPSAQVNQYKTFLADLHTAFYEGQNPIELNSCAYLHNYNYNKEDEIFSNKFNNIMQKSPLFTADEVDGLKDFLVEKLANGEGHEILSRIEKSKYRPSKKLMEHVGNIIKGKQEYILLDEQLVVYDKVIAAAKKGFHRKQKSVIIVKGGPGTGKSVIAINLMADLLLNKYNAHYATGSKAFTKTLRKIIGARGAIQFKYFNSYTHAESNEIDVLVSDEAHRIRKTSNNRFTRKENKSSSPQIDELLKVAKVAVFFIDDDQVVRPDEIGSTAYIREAATKHNANVSEYELEVQFRCNGSDAFVNWINNTLGIRRTANVIWDLHEEFDFKVIDTPVKLKKEIDQKIKEGYRARIAAGFCWPWSNPRQDGSLVNDVIIGDFKMPWERKNRFWEWATEKSGEDQIGTVYTSQGFEFDYMGVIVGNDLTYDFENQKWRGNPENSSDAFVKRSKDNFTQYVKNTYRVLLSRGMKGCYVYFMDKDTERFFKSRIEK